jgi:OOP family OmpA-OmpF porin
VQVGDLSIWIEQGPAAVLATVVRGQAPTAHREVLQHALETIHLQYGDALERFEGDASRFEAVQPILEECLLAEFRSDARSRGRLGRALVLIALLVVGVYAALLLRERSHWAGYVDALRREPGLVVISTGRSGGKFTVSGLRDPLARDPAVLLRQASLSPDQVSATWEPYQALGSSFVLARATRVLQPPAGATLRLENGVLKASGAASPAWLAEARRIAPLIAGVTAFDASGLVDATVRSLTRRLEGINILFVKGTPEFEAGAEDQVRVAASTLRELNALAGEEGRSLGIRLIGHTDADGAPDANLPLSRARAERVRAALQLSDATHLVLTIDGVGSDDPVVVGDSEPEKQRNRRVIFRVSAASAGPGSRP